MKRIATILGVTAALAVPSYAAAGNVTSQVEKPQVVRSAVVNSAVVRSALVRPAVVESALVKPALVRSAVVSQRAQAHRFSAIIRALVR